jgi:5-methylcytosine-specific restriction endonuclease McrBC GTP-binding regulatory subunit McrB
MRTLVKALKNSQEGKGNQRPYLLIVEEINRANVAAVFGDVFQLLDRDDNEVSEYPIQASEDMKKYLAKELKCSMSDVAEIKISDNMFIWATMNSADQGVFPMDTAFKRRWEFTYLGINDNDEEIRNKTVILGQEEYEREVNWNELRKAINKELIDYKVNEDKLMGPYFISKKNLGIDNKMNPEQFIRIFKNKVIMYLFDDAAKQKRSTLFAGCDEDKRTLYSAICNEFDKKGVLIFTSNISDKFPMKSGDEQ